MSELLTASLGRKVISKEDAEDVGNVLTAVFDPQMHRIVALHVTGGKRKAELIGWETVSAFGPDAVLVNSSDHLREVADERESDIVRKKIDPLGAVVLDDLGDQHGTVRDVRFDPESGAVEAIVSEDDEWQPDEVCAIGTFALVVRHR